ncbi:MAG TPA: NAD(+)/NADH kinase [Dehalococcoidia bacterium]|nr:NAD(+)/NADH kinase [Dehalococcoidia bacterium]
MRKVGVTYHPKSEAARSVAEDVARRLEPKVGDVWVASAWDDEMRANHVAGSDLVICCGGDGTVLRAARAVIPHPVPLLGVNLGRIGFLTEITPADLFERLDEIAAGAGRIETRAMIETETLRGGEELRERWHALNDVVVGRPAIGRTVQFTVRTDDTAIGQYRADGVIVATATGSTAYSLSVGGPILHPESREIIVTPVAPHLAPANSIVLPEGSRVDVQIAPRQKAILSVDGEPDLDLAGGDVVRVRTSPHTARFLRLGPPGDFFLRVGRRLNWLNE